MQCTSYIPVYHARDLNIGLSSFSRHIFDSNANHGEENGYNVSLPLYNMEQYLSYDKEMLRQIIQNHDATFRYQVQELHRLYKKQRELMDEMRVKNIFVQHSLSQTTSESIHSLCHARSDISQATPHATSWLLGDHSHSKLSELAADNIQQPPKFITSNYFQEHTTLHTRPFVSKNSCNEVKFLSSSSNGNENRSIDLELPADVYRGDETKWFKERNISEALKLTRNSPEKLPNIRPATDSETDSVKTGDLSSFSLNNTKSHCLIDLNEPIPLESLPSSSKSPIETYTCHMEIMHNNANDSGFLNSDGINSSVFIDLNSMPVDCFPETEINLENIRTVKKETTEILDECVEEHPFVDTKIDNKLLKTEMDFDLNTDVVLNEPSSPIVPIKSAGDRDLEGPVSPENEECSPPRGKSEENIQLGELSMELDTVAAETLVTISSSGAHDCLSWFAEIVSATGDDLENKIAKVKNDASYNDQGELPSVSDSGAITPNFSIEYALNLSRVVKEENETGTLSSVRSQNGHAGGTRRRKNSKDVREIEGFLETGSSRRKKACAKPRKYSKVDKSSDRVKKPMSSILKQPATRSKQGVVQSWGKIKKREGGLRRKASKFLVIS